MWGMEKKSSKSAGYSAWSWEYLPVKGMAFDHVRHVWLWIWACVSVMEWSGPVLRHRVECQMGCAGLDICVLYWSLANVPGSGFILGVDTAVLECVSVSVWYPMLVSLCPGGFSVDVLWCKGGILWLGSDWEHEKLYWAIEQSLSYLLSQYHVEEPKLLDDLPPQWYKHWGVSLCYPSGIYDPVIYGCMKKEDFVSGIITIT